MLDELKQVFLKQTTFLRDNSSTMQETVVSSWPFLPAEQHHKFVTRCAHLMNKIEVLSKLPDPKRDNFKALAGYFPDEYESLCDIYVCIKEDFQNCISDAIAARDTVSIANVSTFSEVANDITILQ